MAKDKERTLNPAQAQRKLEKQKALRKGIPSIPHSFSPHLLSPFPPYLPQQQTKFNQINQTPRPCLFFRKSQRSRTTNVPTRGAEPGAAGAANLGAQRARGSGNGEAAGREGEEAARGCGEGSGEGAEGEGGCGWGERRERRRRGGAKRERGGNGNGNGNGETTRRRTVNGVEEGRGERYG